MAIGKDAMKKNKYHLTQNATNEDFINLLSGEKVNCIICNKKTVRKFFHVFLGGWEILTVNNKVADDVFYVNGVY